MPTRRVATLAMIALSQVIYAPAETVELSRPATPVQAEVQFNRDIRPILANRCFACHGPDAKARKAKLRLDTREGAMAQRKAGAAVVPGKPSQSLLIQRVGHVDEEERMPPAAKGERLSGEEIAMLSRWIEQGAQWQGHWAFETIEAESVPAGDEAFVRNDVDRFLSTRLAQIGMRPSLVADPRTLIRRLHFDLVGLPPRSDQVQQFVEDPSDTRFEAVVDQLLNSDQHAERLAMYWLDLVRYADTSGIHGDQVISMWPYRDWVIRSFRENTRFDDFTRAQLAGDLLPNSTIADKVASGYNRLNMKTSEGGAQPAEYLAKYAADRVRTTATVWLGSTLGCAECHDHKFDPFTTKDFYRFAAFFADLEQQGLYSGSNWAPKMAVPSASEEAGHSALKQRISSLRQVLDAPTAELAAAQAKWEIETLASLAKAQAPVLGPWSALGPFKSASHRKSYDTDFGPEKNTGSELASVGKVVWVARPQWKDGVGHTLIGPNSATYLSREIDSPQAQPLTLSLGSDDALKVWLNGDLALAKFVARGLAPDQESVTVNLRKGRNRLLLKVTNGTGGYGFYFKTKRSGPPLDIVDILKLTAAKRTPASRVKLATHYQTVAPALRAPRKELATAQSSLSALEAKFATTLISKARPMPRVTRVLPRGNWQSKDGEVVQPGVPEFLPGSEMNAKPVNRLDLANWLVSPDNPLTARVFVNRLWKLCFGHGLSKSLDDIGTQGDSPRHGALLDWLAAEFRKDWDVRRMIKMMVMSAAYQQSSVVSSEAQEDDPENREFARQDRYRHDAEVVRDIALSSSGLLNSEVGGKSVKPYQPAGYWGELNFPKRKWVQDTGASQYRRGLYTHWQRTFLHPSLRAFDAPSREECTAERARSNTPLQALALLNDPTYVEAARVLAAATIKKGGVSFEGRLRWAYQRVLTRDPHQQEEVTLRALYDGQGKRYAVDPEAAKKLVDVGLAPPDKGLDEVEHAAWIAVTRVLLNLHETITRY
jgi:cytochrome c553